MEPIIINPKIEEARNSIEKVCRDEGLDFYNTIFLLLDFDELNYVTSNMGFPLRYPHWSFGMEYNMLNKKLGYGFGQLHEIVINTNPAYAYLIEYDPLVFQKTIIAHVYGHVDFFKNNFLFEPTNRDMLNVMADHTVIVRRYEELYGLVNVERFLDTAMSLDNLSDPFAPFFNKEKEERKEGKGKKDRPESEIVQKHPYLKDFVYENGEDKDSEEGDKNKESKYKGERDIMQFLIENADLKKWEKHLLEMVREESYYFSPQAQTKIMNEGWATFWHERIMQELGMSGDEGAISHADFHSHVIGGMKPGFINPYTIGFLLYQDIKERWDKGRYGPDYEREKNLKKKLNWDTGEKNGMNKIFEVRATMNDIEFIRTFMTDEFILKHELFNYEYDPADGAPKISDRNMKEIRDRFVFQLANREPIMEIVDDNYNNTRELYIIHRHQGIPLDYDYARKTLIKLYEVWKRPVYLETVYKDKTVVLSCENGEVRRK